MTQQKKRTRTSQEKLDIVKTHLVGGKRVSVVCEENNISPSLYYKWQTALFENGASALERKNKRGASEHKQMTELRTELEKTKAKLTNKHEVLSELMSEHILLKKLLGTEQRLG